MKIILLSFILSILYFPSVLAEPIKLKTHSIFLSTHAETKHLKNNPPLSQCGELRAKQLSTLLSYSNIESIYSTTDMRTMQTANPTAKNYNLPVKIFTAKYLDSVAITAINSNKNILIIGDNKTIGFLIEFITKKTINFPQNNDQKMLYQIIMINDQAILNILQQPLKC